MSASSARKAKAKICKQLLDLRFSSTPFCGCNAKAEIRVVESLRKPSKGKLYYCCRFQACNFFRWVEPERATWAPSGVPVNFHIGAHSEEHYVSGDEEDAFDVDEVVSRESKVRGSDIAEVKEKLGRNVNFWIGVSSGLFLLVLVLIMK